jgi:aminopeptidase N
MKFGRCFLPFALLLAGARAFAAPVHHNYDLKNVLWKLSFSMAGGTIAGDVTNTLTLNEDSPTVQLNCSDLDVSKVEVNGADAQFSAQDNLLTVTLPKPAKAGDTLDVRTVYTGTPVNGLYFVPASRAYPSKTGMIYTQGEGEDNHYWLPTYDYPDDKATTEAYVTVPKDWTAISNGRLIGVQNLADAKVFHWKMDQPYSTYLISLVAGQYVQVREFWKHVPVDFYVPPGLVNEGMASFGDTPKMIDLYSRLTGIPYPYAKFAQDVVADFMFGGMENVTCVTQTIRTLHAEGTEPVNDSTYLVAHELAHHWFGDLVTCQTWEHTWLNEGFATTLPTFYDRDTKGQETFDLDRYSNFEGAVDTIGSRGRKDVAGTVGSVPTVTMGSAYAGGCSRILMLMHKLGEDAFWKGIHAFLTTYEFKTATTAEFFDSMSKSSGVDLTAFQSQWYHTAATPSLSAEVKDGSLVLTQLQPYYTLDLPVWILSGDNWIKKSIHIDGAQASLDLGGLGGNPLLVDPEVWTAMELAYKIPFTSKDVTALYRHAPNAAQKARIIGGLFDSIPVASRVAIARSETLPGLVAMIARKLGEDGSDYLIELTHHSDKRVLVAAVDALGALKTKPAFVDRLQQIAKSDPNEAVREHAMKAVLDWSTDPDLAKQVWGMKAFDDGYRRMAVEWWGAHEPDEARTRALDFLANSDSEPVRVVAIQVLGRVKDVPGEHTVFSALVKVAQETSYGARAAAIRSLAQLGDKDAIPILQPITTHAPNGIEGAAKAAIEALNK